MDYSKTYRGVAYFGLSFSETADAYGRRDAMTILAAAVERTFDQDLRHDRDTLEALDFLRAQSSRLPAADRFQAALSIHDSIERRHAVGEAYEALRRAVNANIDAGHD